MPQDFRPAPAVDRRNPSPRSASSFNLGPLTAVLIGVSVVVAFFSKLGGDARVVEKLLIAGYLSTAGLMPAEIAHGQPWRLLTPIFLHFGIMHLVFNLLWLKDLGTVIEKRVGTPVLLSMVLVIGVVSNCVEFAVSGPFFGGMSGVVYGLLGYVWMKSRFDPASGFYLDKQTVLMMIGWFFLCLFGVIQHVANGAHAAGLVIGMAWGFISSRRCQAL